MRFTLNYESKTSPNHDMWLTTSYGRSFSFLELFKELYRIKITRRMFGTRRIRIGLPKPSKLDKLQANITLNDVRNGYIDDDSEDGICNSCKEHACPSYNIDDNGELSGDYVSSCCGTGMWLPY